MLLEMFAKSLMFQLFCAILVLKAQCLSGLKRRVKSRCNTDFQAAVSDPCVVPELRHERHVVSSVSIGDSTLFLFIRSDSLSNRCYEYGVSFTEKHK